MTFFKYNISSEIQFCFANTYQRSGELNHIIYTYVSIAVIIKKYCCVLGTSCISHLPSNIVSLFVLCVNFLYFSLGAENCLFVRFTLSAQQFCNTILIHTNYVNSHMMSQMRLYKMYRYPLNLQCFSICRTFVNTLFRKYIIASQIHTNAAFICYSSAKCYETIWKTLIQLSQQHDPQHCAHIHVPKSKIRSSI